MDEFLLYEFNKNYDIGLNKFSLNSIDVYNDLSYYTLNEEDRKKYKELGKYDFTYLGNSTSEALDDLRDKYNNPMVCFDYNHYWLLFKNDISRPEYIKLYIPLRYNSYADTASKIIDFMNNNGIKYNAKIAPEVRTDGFIIRIDPKEKNTLYRIMDFIEESDFNNYAFNKQNPFIPSINNVGIMYDNGYSYNDELSKLICEYLMDAFYNNKEINADCLEEYIYNKANEGIANKYTYATFSTAYNRQTGKLLRLMK